MTEHSPRRGAGRRGTETRDEVPFSIIQLQYFCTVMRMGSLAKAAELLFVTPEAVGAQIRKLEQSLGVKLTSHRRGHWQPTPEGRQLLQRAEVILRQLHELEQAVGHRPAKPRLRLWAVRAAAETWIPRLVRDLGLVAAWDLEIRTALSRDIVQAVASGTADIGLVGLFNQEVEAAAVRREHRLHLSLLAEDPMVVVMPRERAQALAHRRVGYGELARLGPLIFLEDMPLRAEIHRHLSRLGISYADRVLSNDFHAILAMVGAGLGVGLLPRMATEQVSEAMAVLPLHPPLVRGIYWVVREAEGTRWDELREALAAIAAPS
ncbi:MAG: LysR family transcriptional regulator [Firmicutes bacterium]|nr:LysR family transcriptional regulator [Alicyclobacillaceae bacterium]MCL6497950.1 LysR family transcriptional regulator [Bacillota bacterium]